MARTRDLKAQFFTDGALNKLSLPARFLFAALWCLADREGRLADVPDDIELFAFPRDHMDADALLNELSPRFITRYEADGDRYIQVNNFARHQNIHPREMASKIPPIPGEACQGVQLHGVSNLGEQLHGVSRQGMQSPPVTSGTSGTSVTSVPSGTSGKENGGGGSNARADWNPFGAAPETAPDTVEAYLAANLTPLSAGNIDELTGFEDAGMQPDAIRYAVDQAAAQGKRTWAYVKGILRRWEQAGIFTAGAARAAEEQRDTTKARAAPGRPVQPAKYEQFMELARRYEQAGE